ncbi:MAG: hypothetical protein ABI072_04345 [Edaphobacter sp.]
MRRLLAVSLLLLFNLPLISPLFALSTNLESNLPACCRKNGLHHCDMQAQITNAPGKTAISAIPTRCPAYPNPVTSLNSISAQTEATAQAPPVPSRATTIRLHNRTRARSVFNSACQQRGPPTFHA